MRNFDSAIPCGDLHFVSTRNPNRKMVFNHFAHLLLEAFETKTIAECSPSEERVLDAFRDWVYDIYNRDITTPPVNPLYVYHNLNTGKAVCFLANFCEVEVTFMQYASALAYKGAQERGLLDPVNGTRTDEISKEMEEAQRLFPALVWEDFPYSNALVEKSPTDTQKAARKTVRNWRQKTSRKIH